MVQFLNNFRERYTCLDFSVHGNHATDPKPISTYVYDSQGTLTLKITSVYYAFVGGADIQ